MSVLERLLWVSPYPELIARKLYYKYLHKKRHNKKTIKQKKTKEYEERRIKPDELFNHLRSMGIEEGDLLIVHSSVNGLKSIDCDENELLNLLLRLVGNTGTLALPAFPEESMLKEEDGIRVYDPKRSVAWTGILPNLLLRKKGAKRSSFPCNPLVAFGPMTEAMMEHNCEALLAHGPNSCWGFCAKNHAKILFLGIPTFHSNTILHVIEDFQPEFWPDDWYIEKNYTIKMNNTSIHKNVKVRDNKWSRYLSEHYTEHKYYSSGLIAKADYHGIQISIIKDSNEMINTIMSNWKGMKFFYLPKKCLKKENQKYGIE